jgi:hypothetical protein
MTRRGSLAYYLAAWVIGCFVSSLLVWISDAQTGAPVGVATLLAIYFVALFFGALDTLFFAFLLRRVMRWWRTRSVWIWLFTGAGLATGLMLLMIPMYDRLSGSGAWNEGPLGFLLAIILAGPSVIRDSGLWHAPVEGAVTAAVLCLVDRAFDRPAEASDAKQSPA